VVNLLARIKETPDLSLNNESVLVNLSTLVGTRVVGNANLDVVPLRH